MAALMGAKGLGIGVGVAVALYILLLLPPSTLVFGIGVGRGWPSRCTFFSILLLLTLWKVRFFRFSMTDKMPLTEEAKAMLQKAAL